MLNHELLKDHHARKVAYTFVDNLPFQIQNLKLILERQEKESLRQAAQTLKHAAADLGFSEIFQIAATIEERALYASPVVLHCYLIMADRFSTRVAHEMKKLAH